MRLKHLLLALCLLLPGLPAVAQQRVALVVGVSAYRNVPALTNAANDARDLAAVLTRLGFDTEAVIDPDRAQLEQAVRGFGRRAQTADAALFFFAGHALEVGGRNWLLPVSADIRGERELRFEALDLDTVLEQTEGAARIALILLDACRDNPFRARLASGSRSVAPAGLAPVRAATGTLVAFATAPGTVAADGETRNSPFTAALLRRIETPGLEVRQLMAEVRRDVREATRGRQVPWEHSALEGSFFFIPAAAPAPAAAVNTETLFWESVRNSNDPADLRAYLARFPEGVFAEIARNRLRQMRVPVESAARAAPQLAAAGAPVLTAARLAEAIPFLAPATAAEIAQRYLAEAGPNKALAANRDRAGSWRVTASAAEAAEVQEVTLERCQIYYGSPCVLVAVNAALQTPPSGQDWPVADMPRARHTSRFDAAQLPGLTAGSRLILAPELNAYATTQGPRAIALHPRGLVFIEREAANQRAAEEQALRRCNEDPARAGRDGPCYLYAVAERVVLVERRRAPVSR